MKQYRCVPGGGVPRTSRFLHFLTVLLCSIFRFPGGVPRSVSKICLSTCCFSIVVSQLLFCKFVLQMRFKIFVLQSCVAIVFCNCFLLTCFATVYCDCVLQLCVAIACCNCLLQLCVAIACCSCGLHLCAAIAYCNCVLQLCVTFVCCNCVLQSSFAIVYIKPRSPDRRKSQEVLTDEKPKKS